MKQSIVLLKKELFPGSDAIRKYTFKAFVIEDIYALLAKLNRRLLDVFAILRDKSAHFQLYDCFECLSPHTMTA